MSSTALKAVLVTMMCLLLSSRAAAAAGPTVEEARAAIAAIEADPLSAEKAGHAKTVMTFAQESPDVMVMLDPELQPFGNNRQDPHTPILMAAFVGGNVKAQLDSKKNKDDSYAGMQALFKAYHAIQGAEKDYKVDSIDKLEAMDKEGKLKAKVEEVQKRHGQ